MSFFQREETIAAVCTPPGEGGVAVIRVSGAQAFEVVNKIYSTDVNKYLTHTAHYGKIFDAAKKVVDKVLIIVMKAPRSYTGEDTVEIHCHGGSLLTRTVLETVLKAGARMAMPGEFTFRAYMNGKLDLAQAEAVQGLIGAKNDLALQTAGAQLQGALSQKIGLFQKKLFDLAAILEAWVDFPEEGLEFASFEEVVQNLLDLQRDMERLKESYHEGKIVHEGLTLCLAGSPNVGKSSLMNALLGKDRAIVTAIPGTTRDLLEAELRLGGLHFRLLDTAGIRPAEEVIEKEGIRRSKEAVEKADLILFVCDATRGVDTDLCAMLPAEKTLVIWNKIDLPSFHQAPSQAVPVSAKTGEGLEALRAAIDQKIWKKGPPSKEEVVLTNLRHKQALGQAIDSLKAVIAGLQNKVSAEFVALDMRKTLQELGTILGADVTEEILSSIFSKFCVGK